VRSYSVDFLLLLLSACFVIFCYLIWVLFIMRSLSTFIAIAPVLVAAQNCPLQFDGRIPKGVALGLLDTDKSPFNPTYVKGAGEFSGIFSSLKLWIGEAEAGAGCWLYDSSEMV
jgi:hypothetical protein